MVPDLNLGWDIDYADKGFVVGHTPRQFEML
jgi:hypothetical protein